MTERTIDPTLAAALLAEFKSHIRITSDDLDAELTAKLLAAVRHAEHHIGKVILRSDFILSSSFAHSVVLKGPGAIISALEVDGVPVTGYVLDGCSLSLPDGVSGQTMTVSYSAGYTTIPDDMKVAILMHAASLFNNPTDSVEVLTKASQNLLRPYRSWGLDNGEQD